MKKNDIYILSHEIRNPLSVIKGYAEMINENNVNDYKQIILDEVNNGIRILDDYMTLPKLSLNKEEMDINLLLEDIENSLKHFLAKKNVLLKINYFDDDIYLFADYYKLRQVLLNLVKNASESNAKNILKRKIRISIENDGNKIDRNVIAKIGHNYTNKIFGHGIGTTLSQEIIQLHHGTIKYENTNNGVRVMITLPLSGGK